MEKTLFSGGTSQVRDGWERENNFKFDKDYPYGYPWPPRYYTCSFCQREFRSAQALGGHMNIHRRDRARLRDLSPNNSPVCSNNSDQNPNPNPNPNTNNPNSSINPSTTIINSFTSPSSSPTNNTNVETHQSYSLVSLSLSSIPPSHHASKKRSVDDNRHNKTTIHGDDNNNNYEEVRVSKSSSNKEVVRLDLELCLGEAKEDLDLELRLGVK